MRSWISILFSRSNKLRLFQQPVRKTKIEDHQVRHLAFVSVQSFQCVDPVHRHLHFHRPIHAIQSPHGEFRVNRVVFHEQYQFGSHTQCRQKHKSPMRLNSTRIGRKLHGPSHQQNRGRIMQEVKTSARLGASQSELGHSPRTTRKETPAVRGTRVCCHPPPIPVELRGL